MSFEEGDEYELVEDLEKSDDKVDIYSLTNGIEDPTCGGLLFLALCLERDEDDEEEF